LVGHQAALQRLPGWEPDCYAYHGDDGYKFGGVSSGSAYGPKFGTGDIVGCGIDFRTGSIFFTKNGVHNGMLTWSQRWNVNAHRYPGTAFREVKGDKLYPAVGLKKAGEHIRVNFGQEPFAFDIVGLVEVRRYY
jgi:hypothetical protein